MRHALLLTLLSALVPVSAWPRADLSASRVAPPPAAISTATEDRLDRLEELLAEYTVHRNRADQSVQQIRRELRILRRTMKRDVKPLRSLGPTTRLSLPNLLPSVEVHTEDGPLPSGPPPPSSRSAPSEQAVPRLSPMKKTAASIALTCAHMCCVTFVIGAMC